MSNFEVDSSGALFPTGVSKGLSSFTPSSADYDIEFDLAFINKATTSFGIGVSFRSSNSADTSYEFVWNSNTGASAFEFLKRLAGTQTTLGTTYTSNPSNSTSHHFLVRARSSTLSSYMDDPTLTNNRAHATDTGITAAGQIGPVAYGTNAAGSETSGVHLDNLRVSYS